MREQLSPALELERWEESSPLGVRGTRRADRLWPRRSSRGWRYGLLRRMLAFADVVAALLASIALTTIGDGQPGEVIWAIIWIPVWVVAAKLLGLYDRDERALRHLTVDEGPRLVVLAMSGTAVLWFVLAFTPSGRPDASQVVAAGLVATAALFPLRALARLVWRLATPPERVAVIGGPGAAAVINRKAELLSDLHMVVVEERAGLDANSLERPDWLVSIDRLVVAPDSLDDSQIRRFMALSRAAGTALTMVPPCREAFGGAVRLNYLAELPLLEFKTSDLSRSTLFLKRVGDVVVGTVLLAIFLPVFVIVAIAIKLEGGPVLFTQLRAGVHGRPFRMLKFRSMVTDAEQQLSDLVSLDQLDEPVFKLDDDPRVTRVGRVLRRWSIDELPQLWNVLVGDMSLVGPRPEEVVLVERYTAEQRIRLAVKPGLTGPMQVHGRAALTLEERVAVERDYIENISVGRDLRILGLTLSAVLRGGGAF